MCVKNIQKNYLKDALRDLFYTVIIFAASYMPINILLTENLSIGNSILVITFAVFLIILGLFTLYSTLRNIYLIFNLICLEKVTGQIRLVPFSVYEIKENGSLSKINVRSEAYVVPTIAISKEILTKGKGTSNEPYEVE